MVEWRDTLFVSHLFDRWHNDPDLGFATYLANGVWQPCGRPDSRFHFFKVNERLFNGGVSDSLYGEFLPGVNEWVGGRFQAIAGTPFTSTAQVNTAEYWHGKYYFAGVFNVLDCRKIVAYDGVDQWEPLASGVGGNFVRCMAGYGDSLYVGGYLLPGSDVLSRHIQLWDGETWRPFFPDLVEFSGQVFDIEVFDGALYIIGKHHHVGDPTNYAVLRFDGHQLCSIGGEYVDLNLGVCAFYRNALYLASGPIFMGIEQEWIARLPLDGIVPDRCSTVATEVQAQEGPDLGSLAIYPNPARDQLNVVLENTDQRTDLTVYNGIGQPVLVQTMRTTRTEVDLAMLPSGLYTLVASNDGMRRAVKFIVER